MIRYHIVAKILMLAFLTMQAPLVAQAEIKEFSALATYTMSNYETIDIAQQRALKEAERTALEQAGVYIESVTHIASGTIVSDEVFAIVSNVINVKEKKIDKYFDNNNNLVARASIIAEIDIDQVNKGLKRNDIIELTKQYNDLRESYARQEKELMSLKKQKYYSSEVEVAMKRIDNEFLVNRKFEEINRLLYDFDEIRNKYNESMNHITSMKEGVALIMEENRDRERERRFRRKVILDKCDELISLNPNRAESYIKRAMAYENYYDTLLYEERKHDGELFYRAALDDYTKAINLSGGNSNLFYRRGMIFRKLGENNNAIEDYTKAIEKNPSWLYLYEARGQVFSLIGQYKKAIKDYSYAIANIEIEKDKGYASNLLKERARVYKKMNLLNNAVEDYSLIVDEIYKNKPHIDDALYARINRALVFMKMGKTSNVMDDCNFVILCDGNIDIMQAYYLRALAYKTLGDENQSREDMGIAISMAKKRGFSEKLFNEMNDYLGLPTIKF